MQSRMDRYYDVVDEDSFTSEYTPSTSPTSRTKKNEDLYREVSSLDLENFDVNSNVSVIGNNKKSIDLDEIRDIIDRKYHEEPKNKSIGLDDTQELPDIKLTETREYNINSIMEKAKSSKETNYEEDRLKKLRNTQYDILKNLNLDLKEEKEEKIKPVISEEYFEEEEETAEIPKNDKKAMVSESKDHELMDLINTITTKEMLQDTKELDPLDILSDLRGDNDNTKVLGAMFTEMLEEGELEAIEKVAKKEASKKEQVEDDTEELSKLDETGEIEETGEITQDVNIESTSEYDTNEYTKDIKRETKKDKKKEDSEFEYDDFKDLKDDMKISRIILKVLLFLIALVFIAGCVILGNKVFNWGLF